MMKLSKKDLPDEAASLREIQRYVAKLVADRNLNTANDAKMCFIQLAEEVGELARALREREGGKFDAATQHANLNNEFADVLILLLGLANIMEIDIYDALIAKEKINLSRNWNIVKDKEEN